MEPIGENIDVLLITINYLVFLLDIVIVSYIINIWLQTSKLYIYGTVKSLNMISLKTKMCWNKITALAASIKIAMISMCYNVI